MPGEPSTPQRAQAAGLTALLCVTGWLLTGAIAYALDHLGMEPGKLNLGSGPASAGVGALVGIVLIGAYGAALLAGVIAAAVREGTRRHAWSVAASTAAFAVAAPSVILFAPGPSVNAVLSLVVPAAALFLLSRLDVQKPWLVSLAAPGCVVAGLLVVNLTRETKDAIRDRQQRQLNAVELAASERQTISLAQALDALPSDGLDLDGVLTALPLRGNRLDEIEQILKHPHLRSTPCTRLLRAALDGDAAGWRANRTEGRCLLAAANLATRKNHPVLLEHAVHEVDDADERVDVLDQLVAAKDDEAALRWMRATGLSNEAGRLSADALTPHFMSAFWSRRERDFYWAHADPDALLVGTCARAAFEEDVKLALAHGANANAQLPCGATPLIALVTSVELRTEAIDELLDAGADPNLPGTRPCTGGAPATLLETPLWHLAQRRGDYNNLPGPAIELLIAAGADVNRPTADGGSLVVERTPSPP